MASCTSCGHDVTGKKFCPECGTPVHSADSVESENNSTNVCPRCNGVVKPGAAFCMHCGSSLSTQAAIATATPTPSVQPQSLTQTCIACHTEVPAEMAFCTNCGQSMRTTTAPDVPATPVAPICGNCGKQNNPGVNFCAQCGSPLSHGTGLPVPQTMYAQPPQYSQPYSQYRSNRLNTGLNIHSSQWCFVVLYVWQCHLSALLIAQVAIRAWQMLLQHQPTCRCKTSREEWVDSSRDLVETWLWVL